MINEIVKTVAKTVGLTVLTTATTYLTLGSIGILADKLNQEDNANEATMTREDNANEATMTREEADELVREIMESLKESI